MESSIKGRKRRGGQGAGRREMGADWKSVSESKASYISDFLLYLFDFLARLLFLALFAFHSLLLRV